MESRAEKKGDEVELQEDLNKKLIALRSKCNSMLDKHIGSSMNPT